MSLSNKLSRITSSGKFIPEIDGLRFLAISLVVLYHFHGFFIGKINNIGNSFEMEYPNFNTFLINGVRGVELFFVISGFILALPFANHYLSNGPEINFRAYFYRRITRLEPPYILVMLILFILLSIKGKYTFDELFPSLLASLAYLHNIIFERTPLLTVVAWSLEIEVQFYILAPLIASIFVIKRNLYRRVILILLIVLFPIIQFYFSRPELITLFDFIEYFLIGFLLADLYVRKSNLGFSDFISILIGLIALYIIFFYRKLYNPIDEIAFSIVVFTFYYMVLNNAFWKKLFSYKIITIIGGMCYSIYLIHYPLISVIGNITLKYSVTDNLLLNFLIHLITVIILLLIISSLFFYYIEKPCMDKKWVSNLYKSINLKLKMIGINISN